jgi:putative MATE family efflux protein
MTTGSPMRSLTLFAFPLLLGNIAQQLYSTVDSIVVGNYDAQGAYALAAIGVSMPIINLLLVFLAAVATGATIMVSQYFGAKDKDALSKTVGMSILMTIIATLLITAIGLIFVDPLLQVIDTPAEIYDMAKSYLTIIFIGMIGCGFYNILSGVLRGLGDAFWPLIFLVICTILNIILDLVFVVQFGWGVSGVAWATIIAQAISGALCLIKLFTMRDVVELTSKRIRLYGALAKRLLRLGVPSGLTQGVFSVSMLFTQSLTNSMGAMIVATSTAVMRVDGFAMLPNFTFGMALSTFVGQNVGARRMDRVELGTKEGLKLTLLVSVGLTTLLLLFSRYLIALFTTDPVIREYGVRAIRILAAGYIAVGVSQVYYGAMRGAGDTVTPMWTSILTTCALRIPLAYIWARFSKSEAWPNGSPDALFGSLLVAWVIGAAISYACYRFGGWRKNAEVIM